MSIIVSRESYGRIIEAISSQGQATVFGRNDRGRDCLVRIHWADGGMKISCVIRSRIFETIGSIMFFGRAEAE